MQERKKDVEERDDEAASKETLKDLENKEEINASKSHESVPDPDGTEHFESDAHKRDLPS